MWNSIEKFTLLLIFVFILLSMNGEGDSQELKTLRNRRTPEVSSLRSAPSMNAEELDHVIEAEVHNHARFIRSDSAAPPPVDIGKEILDIVTGKKQLFDPVKMSEMFKTLINEQLAKLLSLMVEHLKTVGQQMLKQAATFGESLNQTVTALGLNLLKSPQGASNLNPFAAFNNPLFNFTFPQPSQAGADFNPFAILNITLPNLAIPPPVQSPPSSPTSDEPSAPEK